MSDPNVPNAQTYQSQPLGYVPVDYTPTRPTPVTVLAIIGIVWAALFLIVCLPMSVVPFFIPAVTQQNPGMAALKSNMPAFAATLAGAGIGILLNLMLLIVSVGSLKLMKWARPGMLAYAILTILTLILSTAMQVLLVFPITTAPENLPPGTPANAAGMVKAFSYGAAALGILIGMILPVCILIFFRRPHVVDAFEKRVTL